jgi:hypothetical protein
MASDVFVSDNDSARSYEKRVKEDCDFNFFLYLNIWRCTELLTNLSTNINEDFENIYYREIFDYVEGCKKSNDANVQLLFDLMADLERD